MWPAPRLAHEPVADKPGFYRMVILPVEHFEEIIPKLGHSHAHLYPLKPGFTYPRTPRRGMAFITKQVPLLDCE